MDNHVYNLVKQLVQENKSLWRIKKNYLEDSKGCEECQKFWEEMAKDKEVHVEKLIELIKKHI